MVLLAAKEQFKNQTTTRMLNGAFEEYEDSGTTQKMMLRRHQPCKMLPSTHYMCTICIFVVNAGIVKVENTNISG